VTGQPSLKLYRSQTPRGTWFEARLPRNWPRSRVVAWLACTADAIDNGGVIPPVQP